MPWNKNKLNKTNNGNEGGSTLLDLSYWNLTIRCSLVSYQNTLLLCRGYSQCILSPTNRAVFNLGLKAKMYIFDLVCACSIFCFFFFFFFFFFLTKIFDYSIKFNKKNFKTCCIMFISKLILSGQKGSYLTKSSRTSGQIRTVEAAGPT